MKKINENFDDSNRLSINMMSLADKVKGQGVGSAYVEQLELVQKTMGSRYHITVNRLKTSTITHYHSINFRLFLHANFVKKRTVLVGYVHFLPETVEGSIVLPAWMKRIFYWYIIKFYESMDVLVTVNPMFVDKLVDLGFRKDKVRYIPNFVSDTLFFPMNEGQKKIYQQRYGLGENKFTVLGVGQVQTRKGILDFIEVAKRCPEYEFIWVGGFSFGKITDGYEALSQIISEPPHNVKFLGIVDRQEMNGLYNCANMLFLPSYSELFPMTVLEAMNIKLPILLRDLDLYENILFDYYMKADDNEGFEIHIRQLAEDSKYYQHWSTKSHHGHLFYSKEVVGKMWESFYDEMAVHESGSLYDKQTQTTH